MKKLRDNLLIKIIAVLLFIVGSAAVVVSFAGIALLDSMSVSPVRWQSDEKIRDNLYYIAGTHYAAQLLDNIGDDPDDYSLGLCADTNMEYAVYRVTGIDYASVNLASKKTRNSERLYETEGFIDRIKAFEGEKNQVVGRSRGRDDSGVMAGNGSCGFYYNTRQIMREAGYPYAYEDDPYMCKLYGMFVNGEQPDGDVEADATYYYVLFTPKDIIANNGDLYAQANRIAGIIETFKANWVWMLSSGVVIMLVSFIWLMWASGKRVKNENGDGFAYELRFTERVPLIIVLFAYMMMAGIFLSIPATNLRYPNDFLYLLPIGLFLLAFAAVSLWFCMNIAVRIKSGTFFHNTLLRYFFDGTRRALNGMSENIPLMIRVSAALIVLFLLQLFVLEATRYAFGSCVFLFVIYKVFETAFILWGAIQMSRVRRGARDIADGHLDTVIDTKHMYREFRNHANDLSRITDGIQTAVDERMVSEHARLKSERMRSELITNVSHDIRTPLTSIINYVDLTDTLIQEEEIDRGKLTEYVDVLKRQSARLKKLTGDLIEASKAATGNIDVKLEDCKLNVMVEQVTAEYAERLSEKNLDLNLTMPDEDVIVRADGRYLFRVLDNLFGNVCKYSMEGTRVYLDVVPGPSTGSGTGTELILRNISKEKLNVSAEELTERFVRGDSARSTEGSGLGLSIADSLVRLMGGEMTIAPDGDLFKVTILFK